MSNENYTAIGMIVDKSGSMRSHKEDVIGGYNEFLEEQKELDGKATITTTFFDSKWPPQMIEGQDIEEAEKIDSYDYTPGGMTALLDAIGYTIDKMGERFENMEEDERPSGAIVAIITDGFENSSKEYTKSQIQDMIEEQEENWNWDFVFIGAGIDAFSEAGKIGIDSSKTMSNTKSAGGIATSYAASSKAATQKRRTKRVDNSWKDINETDGNEDDRD